MEGRRFRRQSRVRAHTLLPLRSTRLSNTISCWYCDLKISRFNEPIYQFGQKYARYLRVWFSVGVGFSLSVLFGVTMILIWESVATLCLSDGRDKISDLFSSLLFGANPSVFGFYMSLTDVLYLVVSTVVSIAVHEFGHATAAASEGIQLEYIAIFLAVLFPGALVALNHELLQIKPHSAALRIYCAGIWHNAVFCAACGLALLLLPLMLSPFYIHGEGPVVLGISGSSPVSGYLSPGDVIVSLDGTKISNAREWLEMANFLEKQTLVSSESQVMKGSLTVNRKTYCVPSSLVEKSVTVLLMSNQTACPDEHFAFVSVPCFESSAHSSNKEAYDIQRINNNGYCLNSADIVKLKSCKSLWTTDIRSSCICSENELCMSPVQMPGVVWVEIMYRSPYSLQCMKLEKNLTVVESSDSGDDCHKSFLFVGDVISMARSVSMTSFQPRVASPFGAYLADMLEKILACTFQVSVALALLNSLPVYGLDGESILEASSFYVTVLSPGRRKLLLQASLFGGSIISCLVFIRIFLIKFC
ncbi:membrane-bound transcription factor site-2 protease homolog [Chenopodium quinoa]|uniref:membrane-bound transcription factor site-2 protease homolog n=1 Tax=Chenopodium quinoa TaxID=63459 RepID=UPI000B76D29B|nr:membrane-bound transcription factor site-2 protease homolog [Chenopodium quinoa]